MKVEDTYTENLNEQEVDDLVEDFYDEDDFRIQGMGHLKGQKYLGSTTASYGISHSAPIIGTVDAQEWKLEC